MKGKAVDFYLEKNIEISLLETQYLRWKNATLYSEYLSLIKY